MESKLPKDIIEQIGEEGKAYAKSFGRKEIGYYSLNFIAGATEWAQWKVKYDEVKKEVDQLRQWKKEATELLAPIFEYGQQVTPLGKSTTEFVLQRAKNHDTLQAENEKLNNRCHELMAENHVLSESKDDYIAQRMADTLECIKTYGPVDDRTVKFIYKNLREGNDGKGNSWQPISTAPKDGSTIEIAYDKEGKETCLACWSEARVCMAGPPMGCSGAGWATSPDSDTDTNLPLDPPLMWRECKLGKPTDPCPHCGKELSRDRNLCCRECGKEVDKREPTISKCGMCHKEGVNQYLGNQLYLCDECFENYENQRDQP